MGLRYPDQKNHTCFFITTTFKSWKQYGNIDGVYDALLNSVNFYSKKYNAQIAAFVFMPSHLHLLLFIEGKELGNYVRDFKKYISQKAFKDLDINETNIWNSRFDRVAMNSETAFRTKLNYIHNNPVKKGLVKSAEDWTWSSAKAYLMDKDVVIEIWKNW